MSILKKLIALALVLILVLSLVSCGNTSKESDNEKMDISYMDAAETVAMALWIKNQESEPELCAQLAGEGVFYDPASDTLNLDPPSVGYGKGTEEDGGQSWGYYAGVEDGKGVVKNYDCTFNYSNSFLRVQYDEDTDIYFMNWESIE